MPEGATTNRDLIAQLSTKMDILIAQNNELKVEFRERMAVMENDIENHKKMNESQLAVIEKKYEKIEKLSFGVIMAFVGILITQFMKSIGLDL